MSRTLGLLLWAGMFGVACSQTGGEGMDPGVPPDMASPPDLATPGAQGTLSLIAGGLGGQGTADGSGAQARFNTPFGLALDGAGTLYVADQYNSAVRKVVPASGATTTVAGQAPLTGNSDGTGAAARFNFLGGVALDGAGNLYVADTYSHTLRKVVLATAAVTTLAGVAGTSGSTDAAGTAARFRSPSGVAADAAGNLYVADSANHTIRQVVLQTGVVSTLVGMAGTSGTTDGTGSAARFNSPSSLVLDGSGNLYVADTLNSSIRKVVLATGAVTTLAGTSGSMGSADGTGAAARFAQPYGVAFDGLGNLYVADSVNHTIRRVVIATAAVTTLAGAVGMAGSVDATGSTARFNSPAGIVADSNGNVFVGDSYSHSIRRVLAATGAVTTIAGSALMSGSSDGTGAAARFNGASGVAADGAGNLYVVDSANHTIRQVVMATGVVTTLAGRAGSVGALDGVGSAARFRTPYGVAVNSTGSLYVADRFNNAIRKVDIATGTVTTPYGTLGTPGSGDGIGTAALFSNPSGLALDAAGILYVADTSNHTIRRIILATGAVTTLAGASQLMGNVDGTGTAARFTAPLHVALDGAGHLYVSQGATHTIRRVVLATGAVTTLAGTAGMTGSSDGTGTAALFNGPRGLAFVGPDTLYVADAGNGLLRSIQPSTGRVTTYLGVGGQSGVKLGAFPAGLNQPSPIVAATGGGLIFFDEAALLWAR